MYATGATPKVPEWARTDARGVFGVQTLDDGSALRDWLDGDPRPRSAVVVGGGYIGVEMAEAMIQRGLSVTLVEQGEQPMSTVDPDMGALVRESLCGLGIEVRTSRTVTGLSGDGRVHAVETDEGPIPADVVVLGLGVRPNTALAAAAGLPIGATGGVRVDLRMRVVGMDRHLRGRRLRGDGAPAHRPAGVRPARHARQQAGPGGRDQHRRRVRDLPRGDRHGGDQGLRRWRWAAPGLLERRPTRPATSSSRCWSSRPTGPATSPAPSR